MKKRIVCAMLALIMLVSLVPLSASAADHSTSEAAITVIKQLNTFQDTCYHYNGVVFHTGYGTVCNEEHHFNVDGTPKTNADNTHFITQAKADKALRTYLLELDTKINRFASSNGLALSQNQHDALVVFTFNEGDAWLNGTGVLKSVVVKGGTTEELLNAMELWGNMAYRKVEVNMYVNGIYSNTLTGNFATVTYNANGGALAQGNGGIYTMYYDTTDGVANIPVPTRYGYQFIGWFSAAEGGEWKPAGVKKNGELFALWQKNSLKAAEVKAEDLTPVSHTIARSKLASTTMYDYPTTTNSKPMGTVPTTGDLDVIRHFIDGNGARWVMLANGYWVKTGTPASSATEGTVVDFEVTVTVTNSHLNRRVNATASSAQNGSYSQGDQLLIISEDGGWGQVGEKDANGVITAVGWVALQYTNWDSVSENATSSSNNTLIATAIVTVRGYLNIRADAGTDGKIVGALAKDDVVNLYQIETVNGHQWGRTDSGWICLTYTKTTLKDGVTVSDAGIKSYTFVGKAAADIEAHVEPGTNNNIVKPVLKSGTKVTMTNLAKVGTDTWAKVTWYVDTNNDGKTDTAKSGWVKQSDPMDLDWSGSIELNPAKFTVVADKVNIRVAPNDAAQLVPELNSLNKGVQMEVTQVFLVGENIWGRINAQFTANSGKVANVTGYINLASKYVTRDDVISSGAEQNGTTTSNLVGTVINTDSLRVRSYGATYGTVIGSLSRGETVAVWEKNEDGWYKVDSNGNGKYDYENDGWVSGQYLNVYEAKDEEQTVTDGAGQTVTTDGTGMGVVANTYSGVNVRQGAGTGYAAVGKLLPGTAVEILEITTVGASKWGRTAQGWVCMDYIAMISYNEVVNVPQGGVSVDSYETVDKTTTTAIYTGTPKQDVTVYRDTVEKADNVVRTAYAGENVTIHQLASVTTNVTSDEQVESDKTTSTTITVTTYWARVNDGWIKDPQSNLALDALDEKTHTVTGAEKLNVRNAAGASGDGTLVTVLVKGDKVDVTALEIKQDKVWGRIETEEGTGWIRLDYTSEGAIYLNNTNNNTNNNVTTPPAGMGNGSSVGGVVNNTSGYRYTGTVIRSNELNVRATPSTAATKTTTLSKGAALVIYETTTVDGMAWGRCDAGWVYLYYVDLVPVTGAVDARVISADNTIIYSDMNGTSVAGTYAKQAVVDIYEIVGKMARTELGWVSTDNLL